MHFHMVGSQESPFAGWLTEEYYTGITKHGCTFCQHDVPWGTPGVTVFTKEEMVLCPRCSGNNDPKELNPTSRIYVKGSHIDAML